MRQNIFLRFRSRVFYLYSLCLVMIQQNGMEVFYISLSYKYVYAVYFRWFRHCQCSIRHQRISSGSCCPSFVPTAIIFCIYLKVFYGS